MTYSAWVRCSRPPPRVAGRSAPGSTAALVYGVIHGTPDLDDSPADLRALIGRCLAKNPADGQTAQDLLAELGDTELTKGWLPAPAVKETPGPADPGLERNQPSLTRWNQLSVLRSQGHLASVTLTAWSDSGRY